MQTNPTPEPIQRSRRADRYRQAAAPTADRHAPESSSPTPRPDGQSVRRSGHPDTLRTVAPGTSAAPTPIARAPRPSAAPQTIERVPGSAPAARTRRAQAYAAAQQEETPEAVIPRVITRSLIALVFVCLIALAAHALTNAFLVTQERAREAAHQALLEAHPLSYRELIDRYAAENNLQPAFVASIILNESSYRTGAESNIGARGLMQLMEDTAAWIAPKLRVNDYSFDMMWNAEDNIRFGCWYLGYLSRLFGGDPVAVTCAYHAGQGTVSGWLADRTMSPDGATLQVSLLRDGPTKTYAGRVMKAYGIYDALYYHAFNAAPADAAAGSAPAV